MYPTILETLFYADCKKSTFMGASKIKNAKCNM